MRYEIQQSQAKRSNASGKLIVSQVSSSKSNKKKQKNEVHSLNAV